MQYETLTITNAASLRTITLNRPTRRNALTPAMQSELLAAFDDAAHSSCRVLVLAGAGDAFCAGLDLSALQALATQSLADQTADAHRIALLFRTLYELPHPTIAAVHGPAIAGGTGLATLCDFTLATPAAKFGYSEVRIGFVPAIVSAYLTLQIGDKRARSLLLTGRLFDASEALALGLVTEIVEPGHLAARVHQLANTLIANSPEALAATKRLLARQNQPWLDHALAAAMAANADARTTPDFKEGIAAFLEKRKPVWNR